MLVQMVKGVDCQSKELGISPVGSYKYSICTL